MTKVLLMEDLKRFTEKSVKDLLMPTKVQSAGEEPALRCAEVHLMRLPDSRSAHKKAPYILHQLITGIDQQQAGQLDTSGAKVRSIFCVYSDNEEEGGMMLLNLMERLRIALLRSRLIDDLYELDMEAGIETLCYPDDTAPYFVGEMVSTWKCPVVEREVRKWL